MYQNQLALEVALIELTLHAKAQGHTDIGENFRGTLWAIG